MYTTRSVLSSSSSLSLNHHLYVDDTHLTRPTSTQASLTYKMPFSKSLLDCQSPNSHFPQD